MPRYEYECERCGPFELSQRMSDPPIETHECGSRAARLISSTAFALKGGGWYADGYGATASSKETKSTSADKPAPCGQGACGASGGGCPVAS